MVNQTVLAQPAAATAGSTAASSEMPTAINNTGDLKPKFQGVSQAVLEQSRQANLEDPHRLSRMCHSLAGMDFKTRVGNSSGTDPVNPNYVLPLDCDTETFLNFIADVRSALGAFAVIVNVDQDFQEEADYQYQPAFFDFFAVQDKEENMASAAIQPKSVEEVQEVVRIANKHKFPISPFSIGRNLGYGGCAPVLRGTALVDLSKMDKIIEVNEDSAYALVEPGVTYFQLYEHLRSIGSNLWLDCTDIGYGSVLGNALERGAGYTPYGDHFMFHCGMEVILPDGDLLRTGMGALPAGSQNTVHGSSNTWQLFQYGFGPYHDGLFTQSNYGIVTKMGVWLMPNPGGYKPFLITVPRKEDIKELVERIRPLRIAMIIQNAPTIRHVMLDAAVLKTKKKWINSDDDSVPLTDEQVYGIADELNLGYWGFYGALYGPEPVREGIWATIWASLGQIKGAKYFFEGDVEDSAVLHKRAKTQMGIPNLHELDWVSFVDNGAHCFFSPISPVTGDDAWVQYKFVEKRAKEFGFDFFSTYCIGWREMHNICCLVFNREDKDQRDRMHKLIHLLIKEAAELGYGEYRTHIKFMDAIQSTYNYNNNATLRLNEAIKDALDPNGILAPGKSGIWPARYRSIMKAKFLEEQKQLQ